MGKVFLGKLVTKATWDEFVPELTVDPDDCTEEELAAAKHLQQWIAKQERSREQKHLRAFLKGKEWYKHGMQIQEINGEKIESPNIFKVLYKTEDDE